MSNPKKRSKQPAAPAAPPRPRPRKKRTKPPMMAIRIVLYGLVAFFVARRQRNKIAAGEGAGAFGPLSTLAARLVGRGAPAAGEAPAEAAPVHTRRRAADESERDEFDEWADS